MDDSNVSVVEMSYLDDQMAQDSDSEVEGDYKIKVGITVDPEAGAYRTIQQAIENVKQNQADMTSIEINSGLYRERIRIVNKSVVLKYKD